MTIRPIGFVDCSRFTATFINKYREKMFSPTLALRDEEGDLPIMKEWNSARALLRAVRQVAGPMAGGKVVELGPVFVDLLKPGEARDWAQDDSDRRLEYWRLAVCLVPSPEAWTYCGGAGAVLPVGQLTFVDLSKLSCEVNFGTCARAHLQIEIRRPAAD